MKSIHPRSYKKINSQFKTTSIGVSSQTSPDVLLNITLAVFTDKSHSLAE